MDGSIELDEFESILKHFNDYNCLNFDAKTLKSITNVLYEDIDTDGDRTLSKLNFREFLFKHKDKPLTLNPFSKVRMSTKIINKKKTSQAVSIIELKNANSTIMPKENNKKFDLNESEYKDVKFSVAGKMEEENKTNIDKNNYASLEDKNAQPNKILINNPIQLIDKNNLIAINLDQSNIEMEKILNIELQVKNEINPNSKLPLNDNNVVVENQELHDSQLSNDFIDEEQANDPENGIKKSVIVDEETKPENKFWKLICTFLQRHLYEFCFIILNFIIMAIYFYRSYSVKKIIGIAFARMFAGMINLNSGVLLFYACENTISFIITNKYLKWLQYIIPFTDIKFFHMVSGILFCVGGVGHTISHLVGSYIQISNFDLVQLNTVMNIKLDAVPSYSFLLFGTISGITGIFLFAFVILIFFMSTEKMRKLRFELFFSVHKIYYIILPLIHIHGLQKLISGQEYFFFVMIPAVFFVLFELSVRFIRFFSFKTEIKSVKFLECRVTELIIRKPTNFNFTLCQYARINIPSISPYQWHPFTIASSPNNKYLIFYIAPLGNWTNDLMKFAKSINTIVPKEKENTNKESKIEEVKNDKNPINKNQNNISVKEVFNFEQLDTNKLCRIDGPFGAPTQDFAKFKNLIFIASGIGATPFASIFFDVLYNFENKDESIKNIYDGFTIEFYWLIKDYASCSYLIHLFQQIMLQDTGKRIKINLIFTSGQQKYDYRSFFLWEGLALLKKKYPSEVSSYCSNIFLGRPDWRKMFISRKLSFLKNWDEKKGKIKIKFIYFFKLIN